MIGWMAAKSDPGSYGQRVVYNFPKQRLVMGPQQIERASQPGAVHFEPAHAAQPAGEQGHLREPARHPDHGLDRLHRAALPPGRAVAAAGAQAGDRRVLRQDRDGRRPRQRAHGRVRRGARQAPRRRLALAARRPGRAVGTSARRRKRATCYAKALAAAASRATGPPTGPYIKQLGALLDKLATPVEDATTATKYARGRSRFGGFWLDCVTVPTTFDPNRVQTKVLRSARPSLPQQIEVRGRSPGPASEHDGDRDRDVARRVTSAGVTEGVPGDEAGSVPRPQEHTRAFDGERRRPETAPCEPGTRQLASLSRAICRRTLQPLSCLDACLVRASLRAFAPAARHVPGTGRYYLKVRSLFVTKSVARRVAAAAIASALGRRRARTAHGECRERAVDGARRRPSPRPRSRRASARR